MHHVACLNRSSFIIQWIIRFSALSPRTHSRLKNHTWSIFLAVPVLCVAIARDPSAFCPHGRVVFCTSSAQLVAQGKESTVGVSKRRLVTDD